MRSFARYWAGRSVGIGATGPVPRWSFDRETCLAPNRAALREEETDAGHIKSVRLTRSRTLRHSQPVNYAGARF